MRTALYDDTCRGCGDSIAKGDEFHWTQADGPRCVDCGPAQPDEKRGAATGMEDAPGYVRVLEERIEALEKKQADDVFALVYRIDLLTGWAIDLSRQLDVPEPKLPE